MKRIILLLFACISGIAAKAQIQYGVEGGLNIAHFNAPPPFNWKSKTGYHASAFFGMPIYHGFSIQPEIMYSQEGAKVEQAGEKVYFNTNFLYIPVLFKYKHSSGIFLETGPQFGSLTTATVTDGSTGGSVKDFIMHNNFNWVGGIGYNYKYGLGIHVRYELGMSNLVKNSSGDGAPVSTSLKTRALQIGIIYNIDHLVAGKK